ncbi:MAG: rRNA maturation RNAse YbeY [Candidatus Liptonbacteria bacterium]|nr:rRNA maturation RNAse YbeY [Candidatus Liptonbacteria bacterium]
MKINPVKSSTRRAGIKSAESGLRLEAEELLRFLGKQGVTAGIFLLSGREMLILCKRAGSTGVIKKTKMGRELRRGEHLNVLAFPEKTRFPAPGTAPSLGEVYINYDLAEKKKETLTALLIHGILHLLGYRHEAKRDIIRMEKLEKKLWGHVLSSDWTSERLRQKLPPPSLRTGK